MLLHAGSTPLRRSPIFVATVGGLVSFHGMMDTLTTYDIDAVALPLPYRPVPQLFCSAKSRCITRRAEAWGGGIEIRFLPATKRCMGRFPGRSHRSKRRARCRRIRSSTFSSTVSSKAVLGTG
jgi:hypothetical protein